MLAVPGTLNLYLAWPMWGCWAIASTGLVSQQVWLLNDMGWAHAAEPGFLQRLPPSLGLSHGSSLMSHWMDTGWSYTVSLPQAHPAPKQDSGMDCSSVPDLHP